MANCKALLLPSEGWEEWTVVWWKKYIHDTKCCHICNNQVPPPWLTGCYSVMLVSFERRRWLWNVQEIGRCWGGSSALGENPIYQHSSQGWCRSACPFNLGLLLALQTTHALHYVSTVRHDASPSSKRDLRDDRVSYYPDVHLRDVVHVSERAHNENMVKMTTFPCVTTCLRRPASGVVVK